jgi:hypothetical protein
LRTASVHRTRVNSQIQFASHVFPPSAEKDWVIFADTGVMPDHT